MNIKFIKLPINVKPKNAIREFNKLGYNCIKFSVDRRTHAKQKVISVLREHKLYSKSFDNTLLFEGMIGILNRKEFWIGSPDFLILNNDELYFCEFKSKNDIFRLNQIKWFEKFNMLPCAIALAIKGVKDKQNEEVYKEEEPLKIKLYDKRTT